MKSLFIIVAVFVVTFSGCNDDEPTVCPVGPGTPFPTLQNIWPNQDQSSWSYDYVWNSEAGDWNITYYPTADEVPPIPDWTEIYDLLDIPIFLDSMVTNNAIFRLKFDGQKTAGGGVTAQNLAQSFYFEETGAVLALDAGVGDREFVRRLYVARPDLRARLETLVNDTSIRLSSSRGFTELLMQPNALDRPNEIFATSVLKPMLIHGGVWEKTDEWIGTYGDLNRLLAWKFLASDLSPGTEFSHQLVPDLADDVFLHCRIFRRFDYETEVGVFPKAIECVYLLDYGLSMASDPTGQPLGYINTFDYGKVIYAPTVGPVYCYERGMADFDHQLGRNELELNLIGSSITGN